jgi:hypothetical protein
MIHPFRLGQTLWMAWPRGIHVAPLQHLFKTRNSWTVGSARSRGRCAPLGGLNKGTEAREADGSRSCLLVGRRGVVRPPRDAEMYLSV